MLQKNGTETISEHISDIVDFPQNVKMPRVSSDDATEILARDLIEALQNPASNATFVDINNTHY